MYRLLGSGTAAAIALAVSLAATPASAQTYRFVTGPDGSGLQELGKVLKSLWDADMPKTNPNYQTTNVLPGDIVANVTAIQEGTADIAIGNSLITNDALEGRPPFTKKHDRVCQLALLYLQALQVFALPDSKIASVADLKGKTIAVPLKGDVGDEATREVLKASGIEAADVKATPASMKDALKMVQDGKVQAAFVSAPVPAPEIAEMGGAKPFSVVTVLQQHLSDFETSNPGFLTATLEAGTYPNQNDSASAAAYAVQILAPCDMIDRRAYNLTRIAVTNMAKLAETAPSMKEMDKDMMAYELGTNIHPAASSFHEGSTGNCPGGC